MFKVTLDRIETFTEPVLWITFAFVAGKVISLLIKRYIRKSAKVLNVDPTNYSFIQNAVSFVIFILGVFFVFSRIPQLSAFGKTLFAGAGVFAAIVGFASQEAFSNIISGIFLVIYKPFSVGDHIKLLSSQQIGVVEDITIRHTILRSKENRRIIIPNAVISREQILNSTIKDPSIQVQFEVTIFGSSDIEKAAEILKNVCENHPLVIFKNVPEKAVKVRVVDVSKEGIRLRAYAFTKNDDEGFDLRCDLYRLIVEEFRKANVAIAFEKK